MSIIVSVGVCEGITCNHHGDCDIEDKAYSCSCDSGWEGDDCETGTQHSLLPSTTNINAVHSVTIYSQKQTWIFTSDLFLQLL